jgi:hypothetical protein
MSTIVVNKKYSNYDVYIGRSCSNKFHYGNPFTHIVESKLASVFVESRAESINCFRQWLEGNRWKDVEPDRRIWILENLKSLKDKRLGCFCSPHPCHGDVLAEMVDKL